ncbi:hypothetical protein [Enterococcus avium]|uniref:hypothetical protein n=1 Tax=Enterococcus avium TaxID=33945 RepID=UPI001F59CF5F|nr:hypothetical protein [Enterococcus avium]
MIDVKKIFKYFVMVLLLFFLAILGYAFTPFLAIIIVSMQSVTAVLLEVVILLTILTIAKILFQILTGKTIQFQWLLKLKNRMKKNPPQEAH